MIRARSFHRPVSGAVSWPLIAALIAGFALAALFFLDPFGWHPLDERLRGDAPQAFREPAGETLWTCGMHPQVIEDEPGQCPICHMDLVPMATGGEPAQAAAHAGHDHAPEPAWTCPMHPQIVESEPGACPICGMDLVAVEGPDAGDPAAQGAGREIRVDPVVVQTMNVRSEPVERRQVARRVRTVGYLEYDQDRMVTVTTKYRGWIERVFVHYLGEEVRRGQPLFEIYSPELVQSEQELLSALAFARRMESAPEEARRRAEALVEAARSRLRYWDVSERQLAALEQSGEVFRTLTVHSPASGVVMKTLPGLEGMAVEPGRELFHIADLSKLWLAVELFEDQVAWVREGTPAQVTLTYFPGETFEGTVRLVAPEMSPETRTLAVRLELPNPEGRLRPGMYATVTFTPPADGAPPIAVPTQAVLRKGDGALVVLALGDGRFLPREVELGREGDGYVEVLAGVEEGDEVVTSAQFLLDSESSLKAAIEQLVAAQRAGGEG